MSLKEYRAKRNFAESPEPSGDEPRPRTKKPGLFFCVQKHLATQLHYDFRLEHDGVLLSWAVPKGPSLNPADKRLAMHVEDHPLAYGTFEGVIPSGYGAGIVMLWDQGTWEPEGDDVEAALAKGDLKLRLDGVKLKGSWVLVRTRGYGDKGWLLIKHRDEWAGPVDIATFAPLSVKSGGDFTDILEQEAPAIWKSNRGAKTGSDHLLKIVERAVALKREREQSTAPTATAAPRTKSPGATAPPSATSRRARSTSARPARPEAGKRVGAPKKVAKKR